MQQFVHLTPPTEGAAITRRGGELVVPDAPIVPFIEGDGTGPDIWKASVRVFDAAVAKALRRQEEDRLVRGAGRREGQGAVRRVAAERHHRGGQAVQGRHQGPADHARGRRHPQPERDAAAGARPLRVRAPGPLLRGHPGAGEASRPDERRDLPREHRGRLRRHRVGPRHAAGRARHRVPREGDGQARPARLRHRHQADVRVRHEAPGAQGDPVRHRQQAQDGDAGPQGQHHEVHGRRLP